ncbi:MAG: hypothetical protein CMN54_07260 [SAR324 cluster bacterium]|uniref:Nuclear transport factor 2 family protein n=1 Tax=SAR324 cluster bacterium TaxID=2024889 RepID=A0A2D6YJ51_9DELT|nr:hypothetical protein [SAR324 cluster bacterium]
MTKAETFIKAWELVITKEDSSLVDKIYHPDYCSFDPVAGVEVNLESDKQVMLTLRHDLILTRSISVSESDDLVRLQRYNRYRDIDIFNSVTTSVHYKDGKIVSQESVIEELDKDPSEDQDWNWEDFDWKLGAE